MNPSCVGSARFQDGGKSPITARLEQYLIILNRFRFTIGEAFQL
jgi:hypothetical protein